MHAISAAKCTMKIPAVPEREKKGPKLLFGSRRALQRVTSVVEASIRDIISCSALLSFHYRLSASRCESPSSGKTFSFSFIPFYGLPSEFAFHFCETLPYRTSVVGVNGKALRIFTFPIWHFLFLKSSPLLASICNE